MIYSVQLKLGHSSHDFNQVSMAVLKCMKMAMAIIPLKATLEIIRVPLRGFFVATISLSIQKTFQTKRCSNGVAFFDCQRSKTGQPFACLSLDTRMK